MTLAVRIIPTLLARGTRLVKGKRFSADRIVGHVQQAAEVHQARGVDELIILDVEATPKGRGPNFELIRRITEVCYMPLTVGGGVRSADDVWHLLREGADKVAVGTAALDRPELVMEIASRFGRQCVCVSMDCMDASLWMNNGTWRSPWAILDWASHIGPWAGELLVTDIDREGTLAGYNLALISMVSNATDAPVIAHGGCSGPEDMLKAIEAGASAVAAGALFQFTEWTPRSCAQWLAEKGVETRV